MDTWMWIVLLLVVAVVVAAVVYLATTRLSSAQLRKRFGPEYDRAVDSAGDRRTAEGRLRDITDRRDRVEIVPLSVSSRRKYAAEWEATQRQFVDEPTVAVAEADALIVSVMDERGYPVENFDDRADMIVAEHPEVFGHYRTAKAIQRKGADATTEELREAFVHYRALFDQLLKDDADSTDSRASGARDGRR